MAKKNNVDNGYLAFKSKLIESYSEDPQRQIKWQIEALNDFIAITEKSKNKEPNKGKYLTELKSELKKLEAQYIQPENTSSEKDLIKQNTALEKEIVSLKQELEDIKTINANIKNLLDSK